MKQHRTNIEMLKRMGYEVNFRQEFDEYFITLDGDSYKYTIRVSYDELFETNVVEIIVFEFNNMIVGDFLNG